jgi:hypothetical protein
MDNEMVQIHVFLPKWLRDAASDHLRYEGRTLSSYIRIMLREYVEKVAEARDDK